MLSSKGIEEPILVDFDTPLSNLIDVISQKLRIDPSQKDYIIVQVPAQEGPLKLELSLREQGVLPNSTLLIENTRNSKQIELPEPEKEETTPATKAAEGEDEEGEEQKSEKVSKAEILVGGVVISLDVLPQTLSIGKVNIQFMHSVLFLSSTRERQ